MLDFFFFSLSFSPPKTLSLIQIYLTESPLGLSRLLLSAIPSQAVDTAGWEKLCLSNVVQDTDKGPVMQPQVFR